MFSNQMKKITQLVQECVKPPCENKGGDSVVIPLDKQKKIKSKVTEASESERYLGMFQRKQLREIVIWLQFLLLSIFSLLLEYNVIRMQSHWAELAIWREIDWEHSASSAWMLLY